MSSFYGPFHEKVAAVGITETVAAIADPYLVEGRGALTLAVENVGDVALVDVDVQVGPTNAGPWFDLTVGAPVRTCAASAAAREVLTINDRWLRIKAQSDTLGEGQSCDVNFYLTAQ